MKLEIESKTVYIFDMDGTLVNLENLNHNSVNQTIQKFYHYKLSNDEYQRYFSGLKALESFGNFARINSKINIVAKEELVQEFRKIKRYSLLNNFNESVQIIEGARQYLTKLRNENKKIILATSAIKEFTDLILKNLNIYTFFDYIITAENVTNGKPNPEIYIKALKYANVNAPKAVVFEDSKSGILSAKNAGITCVGIHTKGLNDDYVHNADYIIKNYFELL